MLAAGVVSPDEAFRGHPPPAALPEMRATATPGYLSGERRTRPVGYLPDGDRFPVCGSNGGARAAVPSHCQFRFAAGVGVMALSEGEQRKLDEMEQALQRDDPGFAASVSIEHVRRRRRVAGSASFLLGIVVLVAGLVTTAVTLVVGVVISVAGLLIMIAAAVSLLFRPGPRS